jgi:hypothetical protein
MDITTQLMLQSQATRLTPQLSKTHTILTDGAITLYDTISQRNLVKISAQIYEG